MRCSIGLTVMLQRVNADLPWECSFSELPLVMFTIAAVVGELWPLWSSGSSSGAPAAVPILS